MMDKYLAVVLDQNDPTKTLAHEQAMRSDIAYERYHDLVDRYPHNIVRLYTTADRALVAETIPAA
jgi:hypothetical protein